MGNKCDEGVEVSEGRCCCLCVRVELRLLGDLGQDEYQCPGAVPAADQFREEARHAQPLASASLGKSQIPKTAEKLLGKCISSCEPLGLEMRPPLLQCAENTDRPHRAVSPV